MPTYEYKCEKCLRVFEKFQSFSEKSLIKCPSCKKNSLIKIISGGVLGFVKGGNTLGQISEANAKREGGKLKEDIAKRLEEADSKLPWWRSGKTKGLNKEDKIINLSKIKSIKNYIEKGEKNK